MYTRERKYNLVFMYSIKYISKRRSLFHRHLTGISNIAISKQKNNNTKTKTNKTTTQKQKQIKQHIPLTQTNKSNNYPPSLD